MAQSLARALEGASRRFDRAWLVALMLVAQALLGGCASLAPPPDSAAAPLRLAQLEPEWSPGGPAEPPPSNPDEPTVVGYRDYRDPLEGFNRAMFAFNDGVYRYVLIPASDAYLWAVPAPVRQCVSNFFYNLKTPIYLVNNALQGRPKAMGRNLARFGINTTVGLFGLFDPAAAWFGLSKAEARFEATLADYGTGYGAYLVLPVLGPSDLRDGGAQLLDFAFNPIPYVTDSPADFLLPSYDYFNEFAPTGERYLELRRRAEDPYIFIRNLYLQGVQRDAER